MNNNNNSDLTIHSDLTVQTKEQFTENIKNWVTADSQLKIIHEKTKKIREMKKKLSNEIVSYMKNKEIINSKIQISDGTLSICNKKEYTTLTFSYLEKCLADIIPDKSHIEYIIKYLKDNREVSEELDIRRIYNK
jgi:hypothetical protein